MKDPEEKKAKHESKPGVTPGEKERRVEGDHDPGTITEVAPETKQRTGAIKEMAPDVGRIRPEIAPEVRSGRSGPIQEMAPEAERGIRPEVAPELRPPGLSTPHPLYAHVIQGAIAAGNLIRMRELMKEAEQHLQPWGDLRTALEILKVEVAKLEYKHK